MSDVFINFGPKLWVTIGVGFSILSLVLGAVRIGQVWLSAERFQTFFTFGCEHPSYVLYFGLGFCCCCAVAVYMIQTLVKLLYLMMIGRPR